jgi:hypothetical protein
VVTTLERKSAGFPVRTVLILAMTAAAYTILVGLVLPSCAAASRKVVYKPVNTFTKWTVVLPPSLQSVRRYEALNRYGCFEAKVDKTQLADLLSANGKLDGPGSQLGSTNRTTDCQGKTIRTCKPAHAYSITTDADIVVCENGIVVGSQRTSQF